MKKLLIYSNVISNRLKYIVEFIFNHFLVNEYELTNNKIYFEATKNVYKLIYQVDFYQVENSLFIQATPLLFEKNIAIQNIQVADYQEYTVLFAHNNSNSLLNFDVFAMCFYLLSRYEEYLYFDADIHQRFTAKQSTAYQYNFLNLPIINILSINLIKKMQVHFPSLAIKIPNYELVPTYDIDYMTAFLGKGFFRQTASLLKHIFTANFKLVYQQIAILLKIKPDIYYTFAYLDKIHNSYNINNAIYFFLTASWAKYDKNTNINSNIFKNTVKNIVKNYQIGLHPSYRSNEDINILKKELANLERISNQNINISRQHFLKLHLPKTYQNLIKIGIKKDFSMGYADECGFRAGTNLEFYWYDLENDKQSDLIVQPLILMEVTLKDYLKLDTGKSLQTAIYYSDIIKKYGGIYTIVFHNNSFSEQMGWQGWRNLYEKLLKATK